MECKTCSRNFMWFPHRFRQYRFCTVSCKENYIDDHSGVVHTLKDWIRRRLA